MPTIEEIYAKIDKEVRDELLIGKDISYFRIPVPSIGVNVGLNGGFPSGRIVTIHGTKSAGKSSFALQTVATAQKMGKTVAWIDAEKAYDNEWAERLGVDTDNLIVSRASDMHKCGNQVIDLIKAGIDIVVIDSISALLPASFFEKDGSLSGMEGTIKIGGHATTLKAMLRLINYVNQNTLIILISQQTTEIGQTYTKQVPEGGKALPFYSSQILKLKSNNSINKLITGTIYVNDRPIEKIIGREVEWEIEYNKVGPQAAVGTYNFYFLGDNVGVDNKR